MSISDLFQTGILVKTEAVYDDDGLAYHDEEPLDGILVACGIDDSHWDRVTEWALWFIPAKASPELVQEITGTPEQFKGYPEIVNIIKSL